MRKLLNTLYVTTPETYLSLEGENVLVLLGDEEKLRLPLHTLESIAYFGYKGASPALLGACAARGVRMSFFSVSGRFMAAVCGNENGNVLLRRMQYRIADDEDQSVRIARSFITAKLHNTRWMLERFTRDHPMRVDVPGMKESCRFLAEKTRETAACADAGSLRGLEGVASERYFSHFNELILADDPGFRFEGRSRRPPKDRMNALVSFLYSLLAGDCAGALREVGLDPYVGFLHKDRPGRVSLALDLMEEFRCVFADRLALSLVNLRALKASDFDRKENGAILLKDAARRTVLNAWQNKKQETITHPYLNEKMQWGLVPYAQALLLARYLRGDLDAYPPFFWK